MTVTDPAPSKGNTAALTLARTKAAASKHRDVVAALASASMRGQSLTISTLAAAAAVSRQFIYSRTDLLEGLRRHQERYPDTANAPLRVARTADLINAQAAIKRLKGEIRELNHKLDAGLAAQVELRDERRLRQLYEQRGHELERLLADNAELTRTVTQLRELIRTLEDDLTIERTAVRELTGQPANVTSIRFATRSPES